MNEFKRELLQLFRQVSAEQKEAALAMACAMAAGATAEQAAAAADAVLLSHGCNLCALRSR